MPNRPQSAAVQGDADGIADFECLIELNRTSLPKPNRNCTAGSGLAFHPAWKLKRESRRGGVVTHPSVKDLLEFDPGIPESPLDHDGVLK